MRCADHPRRKAVAIYDYDMTGHYFLGACNQCWKDIRGKIQKLKMVKP